MQKEKMLKRNILLICALSILFLNLVSADYDWRTFGNSYSPVWNAQFGGQYGRFDNGVFNRTVMQGYKMDNFTSAFPFQPLVSFFNASQEFIILQNDKYLQIYDSNLVLVNEVYTNTGLGQIDTLDFFNKGTDRDIAGIYNINGTWIQLKVFTWNTTTQTFNNSFTYNFSVADNSNKISALRHSGDSLIFLLKTNDSNFSMVRINSTFVKFTPVSYFGVNPIAWYDIDGDGVTEYIYTDNTNYTYAIDSDGNMKENITSPDTIRDMKILNVDYSGIWKIAVLEGIGATGHLSLYRPDGSLVWQQDVDYGSSVSTSGSNLAVYDYDGDNLPDIYMATLSSGGRLKFFVFKGNNGNILASADFVVPAPISPVTRTSLTLADLNNNGKKDFVWNENRYFHFYDISNNVTFKNDSRTVIYYYSCIPADANLDGFLEVICSGKGITEYFYTNLTNQNPSVSSFTLSPASTVQTNTPLGIIANAVDNEGNVIRYKFDCYGNGSYTGESYSNAQTCYYFTMGTYNLTVAVRDEFHSTYNYGSTIITATVTGTSCNNNGICESALGESSATCPADCPIGTSNSTSSSYGGMTIPTDIVNINNQNSGLLPEIYFGLLAFLSSVLQPAIIIIVAIFVVLLVFAFATVIKNLANRI